MIRKGKVIKVQEENQGGARRKEYPTNQNF